MNGTLLLLLCTAAFAAAYFLYGGLLQRLLGVDPARATPAHTMRDNIDYVPAHPAVLFGHHFASIAGAGPIVGPIMAAYFGWGAVVAWIVLGCIFIGAAHDMITLYLSVRHQGKSIGSIVETVLGKPGRLLFLIFCWSTLILVCAEFTRQVAATFVPHPEVATASLLFIALAVCFGMAVNRFHMKVLPATLIFVPLMFACIWVGMAFPADLTKIEGVDAACAQNIWTIILLVYCYLASTLPVWLLLQPRDYLNSYLLYVMMALGFLGVLVARPVLSLEVFQGFEVKTAQGVTIGLFPFLFITVACGACSGFHALVASGTTAKQIDNERHIRPVAYGGMLLEGVLGILSLVAVGTLTCAALTDKLGTMTPVSLFSEGLAGFCVKLGLPYETAFSFMCLAVAAFLMTSVDTATRLARFTWQELCTLRVNTDAKGVPLEKVPPFVRCISNMHVATGLVVLLVAMFLFVNPEAAKSLWNMFASANQLLAALTLLTASLWMLKNHKAYWVTLAPMLFMLTVSSYGLYQLFRTSSSGLLKSVTCILLFFAALLILLAITKFLAHKRTQTAETNA